MTATDTVVLTPDAAAKRDRKFVVAALMLVMVLASMEATVMSTVMSTIIGELHGLEHYSWVASIYLLTSTVTMPLYGRLSDVLGRKRVILFAIALFSLGSVAAAFSQSMTQLIIFRGIQGLGAGGIMPVVLTIIGDIFTLEERAKIQGYFSAVWGTASFAGPALGALLVQTLGWRSVFWVNLPAGFIGMWMLMAKYHSHEKPHSRDLDLKGIGMLALGSTALLAAASLFTLDSMPVWLSLAIAGVSVVAFAWFIRIERRAANPVMPPALMLSRAIGPAVTAGALLGLAVFAIETYVPLFVQGGLGGSVNSAAITVTPVMLAWASSSFVAAPLVIKWGFRKSACIGSLLTLGGLAALLVCAYLQTPVWVLTIALFVCGCGFGPASMAYLLGAQNAVRWQERGIVTSSVTYFRTMGGALGVGLLGAVFNWRVGPGLAVLRDQGVTASKLLDPHQLKDIPPDLLRPAQQAIVHSLLWVFGAMLVLSVFQVAISALIPKGKVAHKPTVNETLEAVAG